MRAHEPHEPSTNGTISARMVHRVVEMCRARGHDGDALCRSVKLDPAVVEDPAARIPYEMAARLGEQALELTGDENFGLHLAQDVRDTQSYDAGTLLLMASPTVRVALDRMTANQRYWGDGDRATLRALRGALAIRYVLRGASGAYGRHADECMMAEIALGVRVLTGQALDARVVRFRHPSPRSIDEHRGLFGCPIEFGAEHTEIVFDDSVLDSRMQFANDVFSSIFEEQMKRALARLPRVTSISEDLRTAARAALATGGCTLAGTAQALGVSTRTLQRRLNAEGTSFAEVIDLLRQELAGAYLERKLPAAEVAALLGYGDATAFHHASRRWKTSKK